MTLRTKSVRGAVFTAACGGIDFVFRLASTLILARLLIPEHFGLLGMVTAITGIVDQLTSLGLSTATVQAPDITHRQCSNLFWINVTAGSTLTLLSLGMAPAISSFYGDTRLVPITFAIASTFLWGGLTVQHEALLSRQMKQPQIAANRLAASLLSMVLAICLALVGQGYWALVWREVTRSLCVAGGVWCLCRWTPGRPSRRTGVAHLLRFGRDMTLAQILATIISRLDSLLIGRFAGPAALGLYQQAYNVIMTQVDQLTGPIHTVSQPGLSMLQKDPERYRRYYYRILLVVSFITIPLATFSAVYSREVVLLLLGARWKEAVPFLVIFGIAAAIRPAAGTCVLVLVSCGRSGRYLTIATVHSITLVILMGLAIPWGAIGIASAHVSTTVILFVPQLWYSFKGTPITLRGFFRQVSRPCLSATIMLFALLALRNMTQIKTPLPSVLTGIVIAGMAYLGSFSLLFGGWSDLKTLWQETWTALRERSAGAHSTRPPTIARPIVEDSNPFKSDTPQVL